MAKKKTTEQFIQKAKKVHGNTYDYSSVKYEGVNTKVTISCEKHGKFQQSPNNHLKGQGCKKCASIGFSKKYIKTKNKYIEDAKKVHNNKYNYSLVNYKGSHKKVKIICPKHGIFKQQADCHLKGQGCPKCAREYVGELNSKNSAGWNYTNWQKAGENSKNFDSYKVYTLRCWNENEEFYKIGKTFLKLEKRFPSKRSMPYNYEVVEVIEGTSKEISVLERKLQKKNKENKYKPKINFGGSFECFKQIM